MTLKEHNKHSSIAKPTYGNFARNEWAIVGAPCNTIKKLADKVLKALSGKYACGYADAQHANADDETTLPCRLATGALSEYTDQITYHQFHQKKELSPFAFRQYFSDVDLMLVNGNHQQAKAQVVIIDPTKKASLQKRISQLTNVQLFLLTDEACEAFDFLKEAIPNWQHLPVYRVTDTAKIISFFEDKLQRTTPVVNGLVLAGGRSQRMGKDKSTLQWHGKAQRYYMADLLQPFCKEVYISCRPEQVTEMDTTYKPLPDTFTGLGPYGAILSAFREQPDAAWLVVACDMPLLTHQTLQQLTINRNSRSVATTFQSPHDGFPEPLITIWEPKSYPVLLSFLGQGYTCPRKVLRNTEITMLTPDMPDALLNVNTPEDLELVQQIIAKQTVQHHAK